MRWLKFRYSGNWFKCINLNSIKHLHKAWTGAHTYKIIKQLRNINKTKKKHSTNQIMWTMGTREANSAIIASVDWTLATFKFKITENNKRVRKLRVKIEWVVSQSFIFGRAFFCAAAAAFFSSAWSRSCFLFISTAFQWVKIQWFIDPIACSKFNFRLLRATNTHTFPISNWKLQSENRSLQHLVFTIKLIAHICTHTQIWVNSP